MFSLQLIYLCFPHHASYFSVLRDKCISELPVHIIRLRGLSTLPVREKKRYCDKKLVKMYFLKDCLLRRDNCLTLLTRCVKFFPKVSPDLFELSRLFRIPNAFIKEQVLGALKVQPMMLKVSSYFVFQLLFAVTRDMGGAAARRPRGRSASSPST